MILYASIMHDDHDIDQSLLKKKKKKNIFRPTYPNFWGHVTGNTHTFLFGLIYKFLGGNKYIEEEHRTASLSMDRSPESPALQFHC